MKYLYGAPIREQMTEYFRETVPDVVPHLVIIMIGYNSASAMYIQKKQEFLEEFGGRVTIQQFSEESSEEEIVEYIHSCNGDSDINGIIIQLPVPDTYNKDVFLDTIDARKDVDGLSTFNLGTLFYNTEAPFFLPATVEAVQKVLAHYEYDVKGEHVVLVGAGLLVNQPLYHVLTAQGASVTTVHKETPDLAKLTRQGDFLISATGQPHLISKEHVKEGSVLIDVGTSYDNQGRVFGDINAESVSEKAAALSPVPGGVGPITVSMLSMNTVQAAILQRAMREEMYE